MVLSGCVTVPVNLDQLSSEQINNVRKMKHIGYDFLKGKDYSTVKKVKGLIGKLRFTPY